MTRHDIFMADLESAKPAERAVKQALEQFHPSWTWRNVADVPEFYYKGDIEGTEKETGRKVYIDVKNDSRIADTGNILCEQYVVDEYGRKRKGNMFADYDFIAILSGQDKAIYIIDFAILKRIYRKGYFKSIPHRAEGTETECFLLPLAVAKKYGAFCEKLQLS